jgi:hypothetical protein
MSETVDIRQGVTQTEIDELVAILRGDDTVAVVAPLAARVLREVEGLDVEESVEGLVKAADTHPFEVADAVVAASAAVAFRALFD